METKEREIKHRADKVLTRIYITEEGDVIVTDLWDSISKDLVEEGDFE